MNHMILLSEEIFMSFDYSIHNRRYVEDVLIQKCVLYIALMCAIYSINFMTCNKISLYSIIIVFYRLIATPQIVIA